MAETIENGKKSNQLHWRWFDYKGCVSCIVVNAEMRRDAATLKFDVARGAGA